MRHRQACGSGLEDVVLRKRNYRAADPQVRAEHEVVLPLRERDLLGRPKFQMLDSNFSEDRQLA